MKKGHLLAAGIGVVAIVGIYMYMKRRQQGPPMMHPAAAMM